MQKPQKKKIDVKNQVLPEIIIQIIALVCLIIIFYLDKYSHKIIPPLDDIWYAVLIGIFTFGRTIKDIAKGKGD